MRARPVYWLMLVLAIGGGGGMRMLARHAMANDWQLAVYRYSADSRPECNEFAGRPLPTLRDAGRWLRIALPATNRLSPRGCLLHGALPM
jgi:hypothetical protein